MQEQSMPTTYRAIVKMPLGYRIPELPSSIWVVHHEHDYDTNCSKYILGSTTDILPSCVFGCVPYTIGDWNQFQTYIARREQGDAWPEAVCHHTWTPDVKAQWRHCSQCGKWEKYRVFYANDTDTDPVFVWERSKAPPFWLTGFVGELVVPELPSELEGLEGQMLQFHP